MAYQAIPGPGSGSSSSSGFQFLNSPFGDTTYTKVFVGGLAWETQSDTMRRYFEQFGEILEAVVITDKNTGRSKGYGFVTFREPEAARRACADPTPIIDGRRANCNLASLGRPRPSPPYGRVRSVSPYVGGVQTTRGAYVGSFGYQQPVPYNYQQGFMYPPYGMMCSKLHVESTCGYFHQKFCSKANFLKRCNGFSSCRYATYGPEYVYPQGVYNPYLSQQYLQIYGVPGTVNPAVYPYGQLGQTMPGTHGYTTVQGYAMPGHQIVQFGGPSVNAITTSPVPTIQAPYPTGMASPVPAQPQFIVPAHSPQFIPGSGSDQAAG
ncbi:probable RNA-binding protein ARP1 isoform X2 [Malania oleifera]|uniref:probable RNA-binding protein ARP1 isoform X2 n=1 Tax=Malania oleifera TaxID=397392 RepID=UPI0025AE18D6|nr:probable RNA-binding protein ARP1 isoform X2 [Malania oleifera]XP_057975585.1 probable RNA-binding protein ARP1 isoform X2 [Malania oleifera]